MLAQFAISTSPIIHLVCPQKFVYNFSSLLGRSGHKKKRAREKTTRESPSRAPLSFSPTTSKRLLRTLQFLLGQLQYPEKWKTKAMQNFRWLTRCIMGVVQKENYASIIFGIIRHYEHNFHVFPEKKYLVE